METKEHLGIQMRDEVFRERLAELEKAGAKFPRIAKELVSIAFSNIKDYVQVDEGGAMQAIALDNISKRKGSAIKKIREKTNIAESKDGETIFKTSRIEYELYDKLDALTTLLRLRDDFPTEKKETKHSGVIVFKPDQRIKKPKGSGTT